MAIYDAYDASVKPIEAFVSSTVATAAADNEEEPPEAVRRGDQRP